MVRVIGPCPRKVVITQPKTGTEAACAGTWNDWKLPAEGIGFWLMSRLRYPVIASASMLMIVPEMIWFARTVIDSQACNAETATPAAIAATTPTNSGNVMPSGPGLVVGAPPFTSAATYQPTNAANSIIPSMPMLTTPERSFMKPHRAPSAMGVDRVMIS